MKSKDLIGQTILGYTVEEEIGQGTFGTVYKVSKKNESGHYIKALKHITIPTTKQYQNILNSMGGDYSKADDYFEAVLKDIVAEINILNTLADKDTNYIIRYYENDIEKQMSPRQYNVYILMEYLTPFTDYMVEHPLTLGDVIDLGLNILSGLKVCHENGIMHRDIKEENLFVTEEGTFKLGDFGVSKALKDKSRASSMKGTPHFIAPEVYLGKESYTSSIDLYSLGIVLYRLLNDMRNPFLPQYPTAYTIEDEEKAFEERIQGKVPTLPRHGDEGLGQVILKAIASKTERYETARSFYEDLLAAKAGLTEEALAQKVSMSCTMAKNPTPLVGESKLGDTIGDLFVEVTSSQEEEEEQHDLFKSIGVSIAKEVPKEVAKEAPKVKAEKRVTESIVSERTNLVNPVYEKEVKAIRKQDFVWLIYLAPLIIGAVGLLLCHIMLPKVYGRSITLIEWLLSDPEYIIGTLMETESVVANIYSVIGTRVMMYVWLALFVLSLFMLGKHLHNSKEDYAVEATLKGQEAYYLIMKISSKAKILKQTQHSQILKVIDKIKYLEERLKVESHFGLGNKMVIDIENEIAKELYFIQNALEKENIQEDELLRSLSVINELLTQRSEIKKK